MKSLLVYPFGHETVPIVRYCEMLMNYDVIHPVAGGGFSLKGFDASYFDGGSQVGVKVFTSFEDALTQSDDVLFVSESSDDNKDKRLEYFNLAKSHGKNIIACESFVKPFEIDLDGCNVLTPTVFNAPVSDKSNLVKIEIPVVLVMGMGINCNKFDIQLGLRSSFTRLGYKISQVGTKEYSSLFGIHTLPKFPNTDLWVKTILYNRYFKQIIDNENPDVLIIGIPGGIMPVNEYEYNLFGETAVAISKSVDTDISIVSVYHALNDNELFDNIKLYTRYALGVSADYFHLSNVRLDIDHDNAVINYLITEGKNAFQGTGDVNEKLFHTFIPESCRDIYDDLILKLQDNVPIF